MGETLATSILRLLTEMKGMSGRKGTLAAFVEASVRGSWVQIH